MSTHPLILSLYVSAPADGKYSLLSLRTCIHRHGRMPNLPAGYHVGDTVYYIKPRQVYPSGDRVEYGLRGEITGEADNDQTRKVEIKFDGNTRRSDIFVANLSKRQPSSTLAGGFRIGEKLCYTGSSAAFTSGDKPTYGDSGEVVCPGEGNKIILKFDHHTSDTPLDIGRLSRAPPDLLPGGHFVGETVFYAGGNSEMMSGEQLKHGTKGQVLGPADSQPQAVEVRFQGIVGKTDVLVSDLDRNPPASTLETGFRIGEIIYYTGTAHTFASGDELRYGLRGEVAGPAEDGKVRLKFDGHRGRTPLPPHEISRQTPAPLAGGFRIGEMLYYVGGTATMSSGESLENGVRAEVLGPPHGHDSSTHVQVRLAGISGMTDAKVSELSRSLLQPSGFRVGETIYYTGEPKDFTTGDRLRHGMHGEVARPDDEGKVVCLFHGHTSHTPLPPHLVSRSMAPPKAVGAPASDDDVMAQLLSATEGTDVQALSRAILSANQAGVNQDFIIAAVERMSLLSMPAPKPSVPPAPPAAPPGLSKQPSEARAGGGRMVPSVEEISALPKLKLQRPPRSCCDELRRADFQAVLPGMEDILDDVSFKVQQLMYEPLPVPMGEDELFSLVAYTYDNQTGVQEGQLYYELNKALRKRDSTRSAALALWGGYVYYLMSALSKLPSVDAVTYRGYPDRRTVEAQYLVGRPVQWGAFSSTSTDAGVAREFTDQRDGVIFKLTLVSGKDIKAYSYFPQEDELLVSAQARFTVSSAPYIGTDGYTYVDMVEMHLCGDSCPGSPRGSGPLSALGGHWLIRNLVRETHSVVASASRPGIPGCDQRVQGGSRLGSTSNEVHVETREVASRKIG